MLEDTRNTVANENRDLTKQNKHFTHNEHTFFGLTKMCLLWLGTVFASEIYENYLR